MRARLPAAAILIGISLVCASALQAQTYLPDRGDGTYMNPVLFADYSDPDVIRVGDDFYLTSSSFASVPGLPILHSKDLVNWTIVGHAAPRLPSPDFDTPNHGKGLWAPSLRYHAERFWIYVGDPDLGIYLTTATDPRGPWTPLVLVKAARGAIDPCPLWDDDGRMYLVHAWARSRAGFNSVLTLTPLSPDGLRTDGPDVQVFDGHANHPTIEGPKFYKRGGYYYIFAPAGGVATGWQTVLRSRNVQGPYEDRIVLRQGRTDVNGPHQGAWVETKTGESWFLHFQDRGVYGRVVHLQPMVWNKDDWPVIGADPDGDGVGEPVPSFRKPVEGASPKAPQTSDEFTTSTLGLQWQWNANPREEWASLSARPGWLRLFAAPTPASAKSVFDLGAVLLQKTPAEVFSAAASIDPSALVPGGRAGLVVMGRDTAYIAVQNEATGLHIVRGAGTGVDGAGADEEARVASSKEIPATARVTLRAIFDPSGRVRFEAESGDVHFRDPAPAFQAREGVWVGARIGLFASQPPATTARTTSHADVDWFRIEKEHRP